MTCKLNVKNKLGTNKKKLQAKRLRHDKLKLSIKQLRKIILNSPGVLGLTVSFNEFPARENLFVIEKAFKIKFRNNLKSQKKIN